MKNPAQVASIKYDSDKTVLSQCNGALNRNCDTLYVLST